MSERPGGAARDGGRGQARPGHHDPTAGLWGAAPARSALTLRLVLAVFGLVVCAVGAVAFALAGMPWPVWGVLALLALVALVDIGVVARRKRQGEPG